MRVSTLDKDTAEIAANTETHTQKPIIIQTAFGDAIPRIVSYLKDMGRAPVTEVAQQESERLTPYFTALEKRISVVMRPFDGDVITYYQTPAEAPEAPPVEKGGLKSLFNKVAADTGNVILSEFAIIPQEAIMHPDIIAMKKHGQIDLFSQSVDFNYTMISMGFIQSRQENHGPSISVPVLFLPAPITANLRNIDATTMLSHLRDILTAGNHDMMHHLTNTYLTGSVSGIKNPPPYEKPLVNFMRDNTEEGDNNPKGYEGWALTSHILTWRGLQNNGGAKELTATVEKFYDALEQLDRDMAATGKEDYERTNVRNYFSVLCGFVLMRFQPMDSPAAEIATERTANMDQDPFSEIARFTGERTRCDTITHDMELRGRLLDALYEIAKTPEAIISMHGKNMGFAMQVYNRQVQWEGGTEIDIQELMSFNPAKTSKKLDSDQLRDTLHAALGTIAATPATGFDNVSPEQWMKMKKQFRNIPEPTPVQDAGDTAHNIDIASVTAIMSKQLASMTLNYICESPAEHDRYRDLITDCCAHEIERLQEHTDRAANYWTVSGRVRTPLLIKTLLNYQDKGHIILDQKDLPKTVRTLRMMEMAPEIAFLASPADHNQELKDIQANARMLDRAVPLILQGKTP